MIEFIIFIISILTQISLGTIVYIKNPRKTTNKAYAFLSVAFVLWTTATYFSLHPFGFSQLVWVRLVLGCAAMLCFAVLVNFVVFPNDRFLNFKLYKLVALYTVCVVLLTQTPLVFSGLNYVDGTPTPVVGSGIVAFMFLVVTYLGGAIFLLGRKYHAARGREKSQLRIVFFGLIITFTSIVITNFFLVTIFQNTSLLTYGPALTLIFSGSMAYAILKHRLFDIKAAATRAFVYILSLGTIVLVYGFVVFGLSESLIEGGSLTLAQRTVYVGCAVVAALFFQPIKKFFDKTTNRLFFRDTYDPQQLLDELSRGLVVNAELMPLLANISQTIESHMKSEYCVLAIPGKESMRIIGGNKSFKKEAVLRVWQTVRSDMTSDKSDIAVADDLPEEKQSLALTMEKVGLAAVVHLIAAPDGHKKGSNEGYILLGPKASGDLYGAQDVQTLRIIGKELAIAIQNALRFEEIQKFNVTLQEEIERQTRQLRDANRRLRLLDRTKDDFISMASHQLRTPLTSVKGYLSMTLEGDGGPVNKKQHKLLDQAFISSQRMVYLIADMLNVSRLKTGKFIIEPEPTNLSDAVASEIDQLLGTVASRGLKLVFKKPPDFPTLMIDQTKIRQVIMNFIDNAIYYTPSGGRIEVVLRDTGKAIEFTVADDGIGVPKAEQHHLFSKFYRAGNARKARPDGTGLGLYMAKKVIVAQGGSIIFNSKEGKGSTFGFVISKSKLTSDNKTVTATADGSNTKPSVETTTQ